MRLFELGLSVFKTVLALILIGAVMMSCANVVLRYVFEISWVSGDELQVFVMVGLAFLGTIIVSFEKRHLRVDVLGHLLSERVRKGVEVFEILLTICICFAVTYWSWKFVSRLFDIGQSAGASGLPMWIPHASVTICFAMLGTLSLLRLVHAVRQPGKREG